MILDKGPVNKPQRRKDLNGIFNVDLMAEGILPEGVSSPTP